MAAHCESSMKYYRLILVAALAALCLQSCHSHHHAGGHEGHDHQHVEAHAGHSRQHAGESAGHADEIVFDSARQERFGIETEIAAPGSFFSVIHVGGRVLPASDDIVALIAPVAGAVRFAPGLTAGTFLADGAAAASVSGSSVSGGSRPEQIRAAYETARSQYIRDSILVRDNLVTVSQFERSRLDYIRAKSEYEVVQNAGGGEAEIRAGGSGYVLSLEVSAGQYVDAGQTVATMVRPRNMLLEAYLPERHAAAAIEDANFSVPSGETLSVKAQGGRLKSCAPLSVDGYVTLCFELPYSPAAVPGAFAEVWLKSAPKEDVLTLPLEALVEDQGVYSVFVQADEDGFVKREVSVGADDGTTVEILGGIEPGERVVTKGAMHIKLASVTAVPSGHNHSH